MVVLTISDQDDDVIDAIVAGACGYLLKDSSIQDLMQGIRAASVGEALISPHIAAKVIQRVRASGLDPDTVAGPELSDRETEVLRLIANGKDNAQIAGELHISPKTVKNHISNILMKLQIDNRIQAAVYAVEAASSNSSPRNGSAFRGDLRRLGLRARWRGEAEQAADRIELSTPAPKRSRDRGQLPHVLLAAFGGELGGVLRDPTLQAIALERPATARTRSRRSVFPRVVTGPEPLPARYRREAR